MALGDENPTTLRATLDALSEYVWHAVKVVTLGMLSVLIWAAPAWLVDQLIRLGVTPAPASWARFLENLAVVVLLVSFLAYVLENEVQLHLYNARRLLAQYRMLRRLATTGSPALAATPASSVEGAPE